MNSRLNNIIGGADELSRWLVDTVQLGTAERHAQDPSYWQGLAARMIDAQSRGLANRVLALSNQFQEADWQEKVLYTIGELHLLCEGYRHYAQLPQSLQTELLNQAGVGFRKKDVLEQSGLIDDWRVLGRKRQQEDRMEIQRTWLFSPVHRRYALLLEFAVGRGGSFETRLEVGSSFSAEIVYYPGPLPLRAWFKDNASSLKTFERPNQYEEIPQMLHDYAEALRQNPFLSRFPVLIEGLIPLSGDKGLFVGDRNGNALPLPTAYAAYWKLMAVSGGGPIQLFGEWNGHFLLPLGIWDETLWSRL